MSDARPLSDDEVRRMNAWWRAANYLSVGQIYLLDNPLLREPLKLERTGPRQMVPDRFGLADWRKYLHSLSRVLFQWLLQRLAEHHGISMECCCC